MSLALAALFACAARVDRETGSAADSAAADSGVHCETEICGDGIDNDCDLQVDEVAGEVIGVLTAYTDADGDGHGDPSVTFHTCDEALAAIPADDCDDTDPAVNPEGTEVCDGVDNDCDGEGLADCAWVGEHAAEEVASGMIRNLTGHYIGFGLSLGSDAGDDSPLVAVATGEVDEADGGRPGVVIFPGDIEGVVYDDVALARFSHALAQPDPWYPVFPERGCSALGDIDADGAIDLAVGFPDFTAAFSVDTQFFVVFDALDGASSRLEDAEIRMGGGALSIGWECSSTRTLAPPAGPAFVTFGAAGDLVVVSPDSRGVGSADELAVRQLQLSGGQPLGGKFAIGDYDGDGLDDVAVNYQEDGGAREVAVWLDDGVTSGTVSPDAMIVGGDELSGDLIVLQGDRDVTGDGATDLIVARAGELYSCPAGDGSLYVFDTVPPVPETTAEQSAAAQVFGLGEDCAADATTFNDVESTGPPLLAASFPGVGSSNTGLILVAELVTSGTSELLDARLAIVDPNPVSGLGTELASDADALVATFTGARAEDAAIAGALYLFAAGGMP